MTVYATKQLTGPFGTFTPGQSVAKVPSAISDQWVRDGAARREDTPPVRREPETATVEPPEVATTRRQKRKR